MKFTAAALALLKDLERCRLHAYRDGGDHGVWTIGWGHTGPDAYPGATWTQQQADDALAADVQRFALGVERYVAKAPVQLSDNQYSALVIFSFNVGLMAFAGSTALRDILAGHLELVPGEMARWDKQRDASGVPVVSEVLVERRRREAELWNTSYLPSAP